MAKFQSNTILKRGSFLQGIFLGISVPILGFFVVKAIFWALMQMGLMEFETASISDRRLRTISLLAICLNIWAIQHFKKYKNAEPTRGVVLATMVYAGVWIWYFYHTLSF